ncbi:hypothetical protein Tco_0883837 [Tanacetum coccineum]
MMEADRLLAERLQSKERKELTDEEKAKLFMELMEKRRKHFAALRRTVKAKYGDTRLDNGFERVLWGDLKVMFEPDKRSDVWRILQGYRVTIWKLIDSSGVHFVRYIMEIMLSVIENGDSWVSVSQTSQENGITVTKMSTPAIAEEKTNKKNDVKARGLLLMALPNEHHLIFSQYPDAKSMFAAIETRFRGNAATRKTQKTLLKQQYENFSATSAESLDSIFNRL